LTFPQDFPNTSAGIQYYEELKQKLYSKYNWRPKSKRVNYEKLGVENPFEIDNSQKYTPFII